MDRISQKSFPELRVILSENDIYPLKILLHDTSVPQLSFYEAFTEV